MISRPRSVLVVCLFCILLLASTSSVMAGTATFSGTLAPGSSTTHNVTIRTGDNITATLVCTDGFLDPLLQVYDPNGSFITSDDDGFTPCDNFASSVVNFTATLDGSYLFIAHALNSSNGQGTYTLTVSGISGTGGGQTSGQAGPPFVPGDDRINPDPAAPVAIYCRAGGVEVYTINRSGRGQFAFAASQAQINAVGIPSVNTLIASGAGAGLYRLTSGEFQVNSTRASSTQPKVQAQETGQTIIHTVQRGENLFRIALRYGTTVAAISQLNGIADPTRIFVGQQLTIVVGSQSAPANTTGSAPPAVNPPAPSGAGIGAGYVFIFGGC